MSRISTHKRHILLYCFERGMSTEETLTEINSVTFLDEEEKPSLRTVQRWFGKFRNGDTDLEDKPRSGAPAEFDHDDALLEAVREDCRVTTRELAEEFGTSHDSIARHLRRLGVEFKYGKWSPKELNEEQKAERLRVFTAHLARHAKKPFLHNLVAGDETMLVFENAGRSSQWVVSGEKPKLTPNPSLHPKKAMLCSWFDNEGMIHYEIIWKGFCHWWDEDGEHTWPIPESPDKKKRKTLTGEVYAAQMERLRQAVSLKRSNKRRSIILLHDNASPHRTPEVLKQIRDRNKWEILEHPPYSPTESPPDYHLHRSLKKWQEGKKFNTFEDIVADLKEFLSKKTQAFYERGIKLLPYKWEQAVLCGGDYPIE